MDYFVGLDVSLRSIAVCVIDEGGKAILERSVACEIDDIAGCLSNLPIENIRIGFEAGAMSQHLFFGLRAAGCGLRAAGCGPLASTWSVWKRGK